MVESPVGFHVIKVTGEQEKKTFPFDEVKDRLKAMMRSQSQQKVAAEYIAELKDKATIKLDGMLASAATNAPADKAEAAAPAAEAPASATAP